MRKVQRMTQTPTQCLYCLRGNTTDDPHTLDDFWALDLERDVNWGDSTYLCRYCVDKLAVLCGYATMEQVEEQLDIQARMRKRIHDLEAKLEQRNRRLEQIAVGTRAVKRTRKSAAKSSKKVKKAA